MNAITRHLLSLVLALSLGPGWASAEPMPIPAPPSVDARAYLLKDFHTGYVIVEKNADERVEPASLTKLMTAYLVFKELRAGHIALDDQVTVSEKAWRTKGSRMFIEVGTRVSVEELLKGMIIQSGNDASVALAEYVAGDEATFAIMMNREAKALGMTQTHYVNSMGMPHPDHYSSARDVATIASALIRDFPDFYVWYSQKEYTYGGITQHNRNRLLWRDDHVDGVKTGYTEAAGYCLASSAERDGMRLISVVLGTDGPRARVNISQTLLNYGFRFFDTRKLYRGGEPLTTTRIWKGAAAELGLGLARDLYVTIPRGHGEQLSAAVELDPQIFAPVEKGQSLGSVEVKLDDQVLTQAPLVALSQVPEGSIWRQLVDSALLLFQ
jgi:D-alanyl-D-alanine carboxypeptidase (penicillin-binding protein 5/6)